MLNLTLNYQLEAFFTDDSLFLFVVSQLKTIELIHLLSKGIYGILTLGGGNTPKNNKYFAKQNLELLECITI